MRLGRCGGAEAVGETQNRPFQLSFNSALRVAFQGARVTSDGGLILVRELDERLGLSELMERHLSDARRGKNIQLPLADLLRQSIYSRLAGYADVNDAARLSQDPTFRLIGSRKIWERGAALTSRLQSFETEVLTQEENLAGLAVLNRELVARAEAIDSVRRIVLDMDSTEVRVYGHQEQSAYNGHFESTCYHPLLLFNDQGDGLAAKLRPGNVHSADGWEELLLPEIERQQAQGQEVAFRGDAAFARPEIYEAHEARQVKYAIRLPANANLERKITKLLIRPVGRPSYKPVVRYKSLLYQAASWTKARRVVAKVEFHFGETLPAGWLYRNQLPDFKPGGGTLLQQARNGRAVDQRRQAGGGVDAAFLPPLQGQPGAAVAECSRLQPGKPLAAAGAAKGDQQLVANQLAAASGQDRRAPDKARPLLLAAAGGESPDAAAIWRHAGQGGGVAIAGGIGAGPSRADFGDHKGGRRKVCAQAVGQTIFSGPFTSVRALRARRAHKAAP